MQRRSRRLDVLLLALAAIAAMPAVAAAEDVFAVTDDGRLIRFDTATPGTVTSIATITGLTGTIVAIDARPANETILGITSDGRLFSINTSTAVVTQIGSTTVAALGSLIGMDTNPTVDRVRIVSSTERNLRINPNDGTVVDGDAVTAGTQEDSPLIYAAADVAFGINPSIAAVAYTNNTSTATTTTLFAIDASRDTLVRIDPPNAGTMTTVGALNIDANGDLGFDVSGVSGTAYAVITPTGSLTSSLYTINLTTGAATLVGAVGDASAVRSMTLRPAVVPVPGPDQAMIGLTTGGELIRFNANAPATITSRVTVTGLALGDVLAAIETRPSNGILYGLGASGRLYIINSITGAATALNTSPFDPVMTGTEFGFDYNPRADRFRVVSDFDDNFRVHPDTGLVVDGNDVTAGVQADADLSYAGDDAHALANPSVVGLAYDRNVAGTGTTAYVIDSALDNLARLGSPDGSPDSPNQGVLRTIGSLGFDTSGLVGFEIAGNTTALAALTAPGGSTSLHAVNLNTGAATLIGAVGTNESLRGLSVAPTAQPPVPGAALVVTNLVVKLDFRAGATDSAVVIGRVAVPDNDWEGKVVLLEIGGFTESFTLNRKGRAKNDEGTRPGNDDDTFAVVGRVRNGTVKFVAHIRREELTDDLLDEGLDGDDAARKEPHTVLVAVTIDGVRNEKLVNLKFTASAGKKGNAKSTR